MAYPLNRASNTSSLLYDDLSERQRISSKLVGWSVLAGQLVTIDYILTSIFFEVQKNKTENMYDQRDYLHGWICKAYIGLAFVPLVPQMKCETATLGSAYLNLLTKRIGCPDMGRIYANFLLASDDSSVSPVRMEGYCGEHLASIAIQQQAILNPVATLNILGKRKRSD
ncbi:hypothetical protein BDQ17DRAFT_1339315 [Cyathus striatus]|nr:hypothetical protein BDQ17DRAFT_1339315 [Cyathus striatus]